MVHPQQGTQGPMDRGINQEPNHQPIMWTHAKQTRPVWPPGYWLQQVAWGRPPCRPRLTETLTVWPYSSARNKATQSLAFLQPSISHLDLYAWFYPTQWTMVVAVLAVLEGEAAEWVANLHSEHARELANVGLFLETLRALFEDGSQAQQAEGELLSLKRGRLAKEYVHEFGWVAGPPVQGGVGP